MMLQPAAIAEFHALTNDAIRADVDIRANFGSGINDGSGMNRGGHA
jgi:hypothetical protein